MLSQTATYALRAVLHLASISAEGASADDIATAAGIPASYLAKVLQTLVKGGLLVSERGRRGGFRLAVAPEQLTLARVLGPFDSDAEQRFCLLRMGPCTDKTACAVHHAWKPTAEQVTAFFRATTVADLQSSRV